MASFFVVFFGLFGFYFLGVSGSGSGYDTRYVLGMPQGISQAEASEIMSARIQRIGVFGHVVVPGTEDQLYIDALSDPGLDAQLNGLLVPGRFSIHVALRSQILEACPTDLPPSELCTTDPYDPALKMFYESIVRIGNDDIVDAWSSQEQGGPVAVSFNLTPEGTATFCELTGEIIGKPILLMLDGELLTAPIVRDAICSGRGMITGDYTWEQADVMSALISESALPGPFVLQSVGASDGRSTGPYVRRTRPRPAL